MINGGLGAKIREAMADEIEQVFTECDIGGEMFVERLKSHEKDRFHAVEGQESQVEAYVDGVIDVLLRTLRPSKEML